MRVCALPKKPRNKAIEFLNSNLPQKLVEHMLKYHIFKKSSARQHWVGEIKNFLRQLLKGVSKFSTFSKNEGVKIKELWIDIKKIKEDLNNLTTEALDQVDVDYKDEDFGEETFENNIFDYGFDLEQYTKNDSIHFRLLYEGVELANSERK